MHDKENISIIDPQSLDIIKQIKFTNKKHIDDVAFGIFKDFKTSQVATIHGEQICLIDDKLELSGPITLKRTNAKYPNALYMYEGIIIQSWGDYYEAYNSKDDVEIEFHCENNKKFNIIPSSTKK